MKTNRLARLLVLLAPLALILPIYAFEPLTLPAALDNAPTGPSALDAPLREPYTPGFQPAWDVSLRSGYVTDRNGGRFESVFAPHLTLTHQGLRTDMTLSAGGELLRSTLEDWRFNGLRLAVGTDYALNSVTKLTGKLDLSLSNPSQFASGLPSDVLYGASTLSGNLEGNVTRDMGRLNIGLRGSLGRTLYGPTTRNDLSMADNANQNYSSAGAGMRVGFELTPLTSVFADASIARDMFDARPTPPTLSADANTYALRGGLSYERSTLLTAEASIGVALRRFDDGSAPDVVATLYGASVTYRPTATMVLNGTFNTSVAPPGPDAGGTARVQYEALLNATYRVNRIVALRLAANWRSAQFTSSDRNETAYGLGLGLDYLINRDWNFTADYAFARSETTPDPVEDAHRFTIGLTFSR